MLDTLVPRLVAGVRVEKRDDGCSVVLDPQRGAVLEVAADQSALLALLDGRRSASEIAAEHLKAHRFVPFQALADLLGSLHAGGFLSNPTADLEGAGVPTPPAASRMRSLASLQVARLRTAAARPLGVIGLVAFSAAVLVAAGLCVGRDPLWPFRLHLDPLRPAGSPLAGVAAVVGGVALALTARAFVRAGLAALWGAAPGGLELRLHGFVPALGPDAASAQRLGRRRRIGCHAAALLAPWLSAFAVLVLLEGVPAAASLALGAAIVGFVDACPIAPTSLGQLLAAVAGRVDLRDHARSYLSRRFLSRFGAREFFDGEKVILVTSTLAALWAMAGFELLARHGPRELMSLYASASGLDGVEAAAAWFGVVMVAVAGVVGVVALLDTALSALASVIPASLRRRPSRGATVQRDAGGADALSALRRIPLFAGLPDESAAGLAREVERVRYPAGAIIVRQGDSADRFFAVLEGHVDVEREHDSGLSRRIARLGPGDCFGEAALLAPIPRTATVRAHGEVTVLALSRAGFERLAQALPGRDLTRLVRAAGALHRNPLFSSLGAEQVSALLPRLAPRAIEAGATVVRRGDPGDFFYLVDDGELEVLDERDAEPVATLRSGDHFGEVALLRDVPRTATVRASRASALWSLSRADFFTVLGRDLALSRSLEEQARARLRGGR